MLIFEYYKKQYSNADRQKGIRIFVPGLAFDSSFEIFISHVWREVLHAWREGGRKGVVAGDSRYDAGGTAGGLTALALGESSNFKVIGQ